MLKKTIIYDIYEKMFDPEEAICEFSTNIDLSWVSAPYPSQFKRTLLVSGDTDLCPKNISELSSKYGAIAGDWESGAIAHICKLNHVFCLILRGVTDTVNEENGEAYEDPQVFLDKTKMVINDLLDSLPAWLDMFYKNVTYNKAMHTVLDSASLHPRR